MAANELKKGVALGMGTALILGAAALPAQAEPVQGQVADQAQQALASQDAATVADANLVQVAEVEGIFGFTQTELTPTPQIARAMGEAARVLCGNGPATAESAVPASDWLVSVGGDVQHAYIAPLDELGGGADATVIMGCTCQGNPADGRASVNAEVTGVPITAVAEAAGLFGDVNTVVFVSADGYEVALPYSYLRQHHSILVYEVNGESIANSMGGSNQLWLGSTSARYYARDVVEIRFEERDVAPAAPGTPEAADSYANTPNIGVLLGA